MSRAKHKRTGRDGVGFVALPHVVMDSQAYLGLSGPAMRLLLDLARQYTGKNNGRLVVCMSALAGRGWTSNDTLTRATRTLEVSGLVFQTRMGARPNKAAWYALTWADLDWCSEMEIRPESFPRGQYARNSPMPPIPKTRALPRLTGRMAMQ